MPDKYEEYKKAIRVAEVERDSLLLKLQEIEEIKSRIEQLNLFIAQGRNLIGKSAKEPSEPAESRAAQILKLFKEKSIWERTYDLLKELNRPMTLLELEQEFRQRKWFLSERHGVEVLRRSITLKPDIFVKVDPGSYDLKERHKFGEEGKQKP